MIVITFFKRDLLKSLPISAVNDVTQLKVLLLLASSSYGELWFPLSTADISVKLLLRPSLVERSISQLVTAYPELIKIKQQS